MTEDHQHVDERTIDWEAVRRVASRVQLEDVRVVWINAVRNCDAESLDQDWTAKTLLGYDAHSMGWRSERQAIRVHVLCFARHESTDEPVPEEAGDTSPAEDVPDVDISAIFEIDYSVRDADALGDGDLEHFAFVNGTYNAWPYWRELAQGVSQRLGVPPLVVPVFRPPVNIGASSEQTQGTGRGHSEPNDSSAEASS